MKESGEQSRSKQIDLYNIDIFVKEPRNPVSSHRKDLKIPFLSNSQPDSTSIPKNLE